MAKHGANLPSVGEYNRTVVLDAIRRSRDGVSRVELAESTGLSAQTIGNVCRYLIDAGFVRESGTVVSGVGKPRTQLALESRNRFAVGVHIDPTVITIVVLDLAAEVIAHRTMPTPSSPHADDTIESIAVTIERMLERAGVSRERTLGVGIAAPGPVDLQNGTVMDPPLLEGWQHVELRETLASRLGLAALLEKDVTAAVVAEKWAGTGDEYGNLAFVYYGTGIGAGLVVRGDVVRGASSNAGDIGSMPVATGRADSRVLLGDSVLPRAVVADAARRGLLPPAAGGRTAEIRERFLALAELARGGDATALDLVDGICASLASGIVTMSNLLDLECIVFGGPYFTPVADLLLGRIAQRVRTDPHLIAPHELVFASSSVGDDVIAVGAACLVLDHTFSPRPAGLLIRG